MNHESPGVQAHLTIMQGVIQRMAENSRSCKVWCVTLVSAILMLVAQTGDPRHALIALAPTALFFVLDAYYLALERGFRNSYNAFVLNIHGGEASTSDLYSVLPRGRRPRECSGRCSCRSRCRCSTLWWRPRSCWLGCWFFNHRLNPDEETTHGRQNPASQGFHQLLRRGH